VIGGPPCQTFSRLANLVRAQGRETTFGDLIPEFARVVNAAEPAWFLMENVPNAYAPKCSRYGISDIILDNAELGEVQRRKRRFWFGLNGLEAKDLLRRIPKIHREGAGSALSVTSHSRAVPVKLGGSGKVKRTWEGGKPEQRTLCDMLELQGLPRDWMEHQPWKMVAKRKMVGNGVPVPMGRAIARAVRITVEASR